MVKMLLMSSSMKTQSFFATDPWLKSIETKSNAAATPKCKSMHEVFFILRRLKVEIAVLEIANCAVHQPQLGS